MALSALLLTRGISAGIPPPNLVTISTNGIVCAAASLQYPGRESAAKLDGKGFQQRCLPPPPAHSIPAGGPPPNLVTSSENDIVHSAAGQQPPGKEPISKLDGLLYRRYDLRHT